MQSLKGDAVGDLGFDPIGVSSWANMLYLREAEIKHGRIAMLAFAGIVVEVLGIKAPGVQKIFGSSTVSHTCICMGTSFSALCVMICEIRPARTYFPTYIHTM
jgi:hypothetical protein